MKLTSCYSMLAGFGIACLVARGARAEVTDQERAAAQRLFVDGVALLKRGEVGPGCSKLDQSALLLPRASTMVKIGICRRSENRYVASWQALERARELNAADPANFRPDLEQEINEEQELIPTLKLAPSALPPELALFVDDQHVAQERALRPIPIELGAHVVRAQAPGYEVERVSVTVFGAQQYVVPLELRAVESVQPSGAFPSSAEAAAPLAKPVAEPGTPAARAVDQGSPATDSSSLGTQKVAGLALGAVGIVGLSVGGVFGILTLSRVSDSDPHCQYPDGTCDAEGVELRNQARQLQTKGFIAAGVGAAAFAAGAYLYFTAPRSRVSVSARFNGSATRGPGAELSGALRF